MSLCPWLGTDRDVHTQYREPAEEHVCYSQTPPAIIATAHQVRYCLGAAPATCPHFSERVPAERPASPPPVSSPVAEDEMGDGMARPLSPAQIALWVAIGLLVVVAAFYFGAGGLFKRNALAAPTPSSAAKLTAAPTATATLSPAVVLSPIVESSPLPVAASALHPGPTPTPNPGGRVYGLEPVAGSAGWVASDEQRGNHLGDSFLHAGVFDGITYHAALQFDLSRLPRGAPLYSATLQLTGLDARRLGNQGSWEVRVLLPSDAESWPRSTYQDVHNARIAWSLVPALAPGELQAGANYTFELSGDELRDLEQRLVAEQYALVFRIDGPLAGPNSLFTWDTGQGAATLGHPPRLIVSAGAAPSTVLPIGPTPGAGSAEPGAESDWFVVTSTPTPGNAATAAAVALRGTAWATTTGTPTPLPPFVVTATPAYVVVTNTPTPGNSATAEYWRELATANVVLTGTSTPTPVNLATATPTPRPTDLPPPTNTPVLIWLDDLTPPPTPTPTPTMPPMPQVLEGKILFLSDRFGRIDVLVLDPDTGRLALLTAHWPYDAALRRESGSPDGRSRAFVKNDGQGVPQVHVDSSDYGSSWQVTYNTGMSYDPVWSPLGDRLAFVSNESGSDDIYTINPDGTDVRRLTLNNWEWDKHPSWSPDAKRLVYWSNAVSGRRQIWITNADGTGQQPLSPSAYNDWDPVWVK